MSEERAVLVVNGSRDTVVNDYWFKDPEGLGYYLDTFEGELQPEQIVILRPTTRPVPHTENPVDGYMHNTFYWEVMTDE